MSENKVEIMDDDEEGQEVQTGALMQINSAEINQQIMTAKAYPRDITTFRKDVVTSATIDENVAKSCMYALKRKNADGSTKMIEGPSARFAEIVAQSWGNCRAGARVVEVGETHITAQGFFYDLQNNIAITFEVMRPIVGKKSDEHPHGKRFSNDMISVTGNAACSIALRNAVFKGVPKAFWNHGYLAARGVVAGDLATIGERRTKAIKAFEQWGIVPEQIYALLGVKGAPDMTLDHIVFLGGLHSSIQEGEQKAEDAFHPDNFASGTVMARPERSMFARQDSKPAAEPEKKAEKSPVEEKADAKAAEAQTGQREPEPEEKVDPRKQDYEDWFVDMKKEAATFKTVPTLQSFIDGVLPNLDAEKEKEFLALTDALRREIMDAVRAGKGKK